MIYTLTLNPSIDYIIEVDSLNLGLVNRTTKEVKFPGGKGINVSRVLSNLNIENKALGFLGGLTGKFIESSLKNLNVNCDFINVVEDSRINVKIKGIEETEINASGPKISNENFKELMTKLANLDENDILVLAGSVQNSLPNDIYMQIQTMLKNKNVKIIVDTSGPALLEAVKQKPFLIKPNNHEIEEIFNVTINCEKDLIKYGSELVKLGAENVIISMAGDGALLICNEGIFKGNAPKGVVKNSVGAGDSLVGGFLAEYSISNDIVKSFKMGIASGSASAFSMDLCTKDEVYDLLPKINITKMEE
ncbi:1-phosphofructokinase [Clostridium septicum]|uniref:Tagatose-6-phosphate kinase n=1 Tax=Clostridium septicum TaxID=1504 RepID=A0A9N7PK09_CLOSE|nr:1-phosphofructokinase [Clostridium septicum]AYE33046.1 1-phosphofructokinase [Clostridium septicum]MDU1313443.1 1-phosphofructokinase [Clostridium septicum]QAS61215.1 1-phosphofructokinase [Clostridium septicum]UEC19434.1 1-phosphofructokinase [Clostridium septicum]USR99613.1 1-phosphofructokinase [Clostridium septicum]